MKKIAVYPGSFDPITMGHVDIIHRISKLFDQTIVLVSQSPQKNYLFSVQERIELIKLSLKGVQNVEVDSKAGLTVDYVRSRGAQVIVRGLRAVVDFEYEMTMSSINKKLNSEIETMLVFARPEYYYISSRGVKELALNGGALQDLVPVEVIPHLQKKMMDKKTSST